MSVRQLHERGDSIHDGVQGRKHRPNCTQPCCVPELNAEGFWGEPVHRWVLILGLLDHLASLFHNSVVRVWFFFNPLSCFFVRGVASQHNAQSCRAAEGALHFLFCRAWSALSETTAGEDNMFVSPPFRHNDIPVPNLFECLTPAPLPIGAPYAMLGPVNNYASRDREPWQVMLFPLHIPRGFFSKFFCRIC